MNNNLLNIVDTDIKKWDYLKDFVPDLDYHKVWSNYRCANNFVGHIQRAFVIYWAIQEHMRTGGIGIEPGCGQAISPFCVGTDVYAGKHHPQYGGSYYPHVRCMGEILPFKNETFDFIVSHHSLEHMKNTENTLREWIRVLKTGGKIAIVMPDKRYGPFGDNGHVSECTPDEFIEILEKIENIKVFELDTFNNFFSFNVLLEKIGDTMEINETDLKTNMRNLLQDHVTLLRMIIVSLLADLKDVNTIRNKLRKKNIEIGNVVGEHFRDVNVTKQMIKELMDKPLTTKLTNEEKKIITNYHAGNMLALMLNNRTLHIMNYVMGKKTGDVELMKSASTEWNENDISISGQLSVLSQVWDKDAVKPILFSLSESIRNQIVARISEDFNDDFNELEKTHKSALKFADALTVGLTFYGVEG